MIDLALAIPHTGMPADIIPLQYHANMLTDAHRMDSFAAATAAVVRPGMHVLDLGAGTGVLSVFAARQGATVTAVEREPGVLEAARAARRAAREKQIEVLGGFRERCSMARGATRSGT